MFRRLKANWEILLLTAAVILMNLWYLRPQYVPSHDTMHVFEIFYFYYNELFFHLDLPRWRPYGAFGIPLNYWQLMAFTPMSYLFMAIGLVFRVTDVMMLFKLSMIGEQFVVLLGTYLLGRRLFASRTTVFILSLAAVCGISWHSQVFFEFRMYYLFPLTAYFLLSFFRERKAEFLWLTGLTMMAWVMGNPFYVIFIWIFVFAIMFAVLFVRDMTIWRCLVRFSTRSLALLGLLILISAAFFYQLKGMMAFAELYQRGAGGTNSLGFFITYGGTPVDLSTFLRYFVQGQQPQAYIGILPVVCFIVALLKVRSREFVAFAAPTIMLFWLSLGGVLSVFTYFFPGMMYYRHISFLYSLTGMMMLMCSGFGLDYLWQVSIQKKAAALITAAVILVFLFDCTLISWKGLADLSLSASPLNTLVEKIHGDSHFLRIGIYLTGLGLVSALAVYDHFFRRGKEGLSAR